MFGLNLLRKRHTIPTDQRLKVGLFTDSFPPTINGVSIAVSDLHAALLAYGVDSHVFTFGNHKSTYPNVWVTRGVPLGNSHFYSALMLDQPSTLVAQTLSVFHINDPFNIAYVALRMAKRLRRPVIFTNHTRHDLYLEERWSSVLRPVLKLYVETHMTYMMRLSDLITAPSHSALRWMQQLAPQCADRMRVIHNGIALQRFEQLPADILRREQLGIAEGATIFGYVGRLAPEKNLEVFAEAFVRAVHQGANAHWIIIGEGSTRAVLESITVSVAERVHFLGRVPNQALLRYMPLFDVFATSSLSEVHPISVIEAMACRKPFLGVRADWWEEYPNHWQAGILTENDPFDLAAAIQWFCKNEEARRVMGDHAYQISRHFDIRNIATQWIELYSQLAERHALTQAS
ncbi:MAG: glycosyltransferase [Anaerolineae bacterium]|nr:glycosyltransferase [Anaerolineae bacterium]